MSVELLSYHQIQLSDIEESLRLLPTAMLVRAKLLVMDVNNEPVELCGRVPLFFLFVVFSLLYPRTSELVYRSDETQKGIVIYSRLNDNQIIRPNDVVEPDFKSDELDIDNTFGLISNNDSTEIDLGKIWQESGQEITLFILMVMKLCEDKHKVTFLGKVSPEYGLLALRVALDRVDSVYYEDILLKKRV